MANKEVLNLEVKANIKQVAKDTEILQAKLENTKLETKELIKDFGAFGITVGGVKQKFADAAKIMGNGLKIIKLQAKLAANSFKLMFGGKMKTGARVLFSTIKAGIAATGIGLLVVAFAGLVQYFKDSEAGASKFKQITSQLGVVVGNVTDIISNLGKAVFKLVTGDFKGFKDSLGEVTQGVKDFGETTRKEMGQANQLEKDRLELQIFEREAIVEKAKTEKDMMELRLKARDFETFSAEERLGFMRQANKLAAEQLEKDLHVAKEKLRFQVEENSFSKSTQENLDAEAQLKAQVFQLERSNFSERKRLKSEEQAIVKEIMARDATAEKKRIASEKLDLEAFTEWKLTRIENETDAEFKIRIKAAKDTAAAQKKIDDKAAADKKAADKKAADDKKKFDDLVESEKQKTISAGFAAAGALAAKDEAASKAVAVAKTIYNTQQAIMNAMANVPAPYNFVQAGIAGGMGIAAIHKILATSPENASAGDSSVPTASEETPAPEMLSGAFTLGGGITPEPARAYVVSDDITANQNKLAIIRRRATI
jgi:hypothetical protein